MNKTGVILLSRQPLRPCRRNKWLVRTVMAFKALARDRLQVLTSHGMQTWDILTALASLHNVPRKIYIPASSQGEFMRKADSLTEQFILEPSLTTFVPVLFDSDIISKKEALILRDERIVGEADLLLPVSIKSGGNMETLLNRFNHKDCSRTFQTEYRKREESLAYEIKTEELSDEIKSLNPSYFFHWTRTFNTAWPDEKLLDFYRAVLTRDTYPRKAFDSLRHILSRNRICATSDNMPNNRATVSFTGLTPKEFLPLMRWRARYCQMSFEPYGIGVDKEFALDTGIRPVIYYDKNDSGRIENENRWLTQSHGEITDWRQEKEYRCEGDFDLNDIPCEKLIAVCRFPVEAHEIQTLTGIRTIPFVRG